MGGIFFKGLSFISKSTVGQMEKAEVKCLEVSRTKRRGTSSIQDEILIPGLPNDVAILCLVRVARPYHFNMSGVCRTWRDFLEGRVFWEMRRELSLVEEWIYLWTESKRDRGNAWHAFDPSSNKWFKLPVMPDDDRMAGHSSFASVDGKIFVIGGSFQSTYNATASYAPCKTVSYFDTRSYRWERIADLNIARIKCMTGVIDNQLYVFGGHLSGDGPEDTTPTAEAYDPITGTWKFITSMEMSNMEFPTRFDDSAVMGGKFYLRNWCLEGLVYDPRTDVWDDMANGLQADWPQKTAVLNGKLYKFDYQNVPGLSVYNPGKDSWETVDGIWDHCALPLVMGEFEVVNLGGKFCIASIECDHSDPKLGKSIFMSMLEIRDSTEHENHKSFVTFSDEITEKIHYTGMLFLQPTEFQDRQTVALFTVLL